MNGGGQGGSAVRQSRLRSGLRVVTEDSPALQSATFGFWVETGSRDESVEQGGISHFVEHLLFKGTEHRDARAIAEEVESIGGHLNAFTSRELTCYHARVLAEHAPVALDVLLDVLCCSTFPLSEVEHERTVILAEIAESEDAPDHQAHQFFDAAFWKGGPLGRPICGTPETVGSLQRQDFVDYLSARYRPDRIVVSAAGRVDHDWLVARLEEAFGGETPGERAAPGKPAETQGGLFVQQREVEQVQVLLGLPAVSLRDPRRYAARVLSCALGEGMSSRLFQEVRETRGLAYSIYSYLETLEHEGYLGVYGAMAPAAVPEAIDVIRGIFRAICRQGLLEDEIARARNQLGAGLVMGLESSVNRMQRLAMNEIYFGRCIPVEEVRAEIARVDAAAIAAVAEEVLDDRALNVTLLGPVGDARPDLSRSVEALAAR